MAVLEIYLPLARDESKTEKQEHPIAARGQWIFFAKVTEENRDHCETLVKLGNHRIVD